MSLRNTSELISAGVLSIGDGYRAKNSELSTNGYPFARAGNIKSGFQFDGADCIAEEDIEKVKEKRSQPGDIVFTSKGTVGRFAYVTEDTQPFVFSPQVCYWRVHDILTIDNRWLYYWMHSKEFYAQVAAVKGQTDMADYVSLSDQRKFHITVPPLREQRRIAGILSAFDDKIDLLRAQNRTLEGMAEALFRQWFVEERGDDWEEGQLGDLVSFNYGKSLPKRIRTGSGYPVYGSSGIDGYHEQKLVCGPGVITGRKGTIGIINYEYGSFFCIDTTYYITPKVLDPDLIYTFHLVSSIRLREMNTDSAVPGLNRKNAESVNTILPPQSLITSFNEIVGPFWKARSENNRNLETAMNIRSTLIPKLITR